MSEGREQTIRELIGAQRHTEVVRRLRRLSDRQVGQLMFDVVWDELGLANPAMGICAEGTERLFRSPAGVRTSERFNELAKLPECPRCGQPMMHCIGLDGPDYRQCVSLKCGHKIEERND